MKLRIWKPPESYCKGELNGLIDRVKNGDSDAIEEAVVLTAKESFGLWHGRARAKICRNLKNRSILQPLKDLLIQAICIRLAKGNFSEQFKDQIAMAVRFSPGEMQKCAEKALESEKVYVRQYARWTLNKIANTSE